MSSARRWLLITISIAASLAGGCASAGAPVPRVATDAATSTPGDHVATPRYKIDIDYPDLTARDVPLADALHATGGKARREFVQSLPDSKEFPEFADRQLQLLIEFKVAAQTNDFVSVHETGMQDSGGAHPIPIDSTFVYDIPAQKLISLDDLFADPVAARKRLADFARAALMKKMMAQAPKPGEGSPEAIREWQVNTKQMIDDGTKPTAENFANFIVRADAQASEPGSGLTLIFPPYQVAAYVYGTQAVEVPARVFAAMLKPQYRSAFEKSSG